MDTIRIPDWAVASLDAREARQLRARVARLARLTRKERLERLLTRRAFDYGAAVLALGEQVGAPWAVRTLQAAMRDRRRPGRAGRAAESWFQAVVAANRHPAWRRLAAQTTVGLMTDARLETWMHGQVVEHSALLALPPEPRPRWARELVEALGRVLDEHPHPDIRADAVYALGNLGGRRARVLLRAAQRDRGEFWGGRVGSYARYFGRRLDRPPATRDFHPMFRFVSRPASWYAARDRGAESGPPRARMKSRRGTRR